MAPTYGQLTADAIASLTGDASLMDSLSAPAMVTSAGLFEAISDTAGKASIAGLPADVADEASAVAMSTLKFVLEASQGNVGTAVGELARTALNFVPVFGQIVGVMVDLFNAAGQHNEGIGPASSVKAERAQWCQGQFSLPNGTGPGKQIMPADIFGPSTNGYGESVSMSSLGRALVAMTEPDSIGMYNSAGNQVGSMTIETVQKLANTPGDPLNWKRWAFSPGLGVPAKMQALCRNLRLAIAAMRNRKETDGGAALMLVLTDLIRILWDRGHMSGYYFAALMDADLNWIHSDVRTHGETCLTHDKRGYQGALDLVEGWRATLDPYAQFSDPDELEQAEGELVGRVQGALDRANRLTLLAAALEGKGPRRNLGNFGMPRRRLGGAHFS